MSEQFGPNSEEILEDVPNVQFGPNTDEIIDVVPNVQFGPNTDEIIDVVRNVQFGPNTDEVLDIIRNVQFGPNTDEILDVIPNATFGPSFEDIIEVLAQMGIPEKQISKNGARRIQTDNIDDGVVTSAKLATSAVGLTNLANGSVNESKILASSLLTGGGLTGGSGTKLSIVTPTNIERLGNAGFIGTVTDGIAYANHVHERDDVFQDVVTATAAGVGVDTEYTLTLFPLRNSLSSYYHINVYLNGILQNEDDPDGSPVRNYTIDETGTFAKVIYHGTIILTGTEIFTFKYLV